MRCMWFSCFSVCDVNLCSKSSVSCAPGLSLVETAVPGDCCPHHHCGTCTHAHSYICNWRHFWAVITLNVVMLIANLQKFHTTSLFNFLLLRPECRCEDAALSICQLVSLQKKKNTAPEVSVCQKMNKFSRVSILFSLRGRSWLKSLTAAPSAAVLSARVVRESTSRAVKADFVYVFICVTHRYRLCMCSCVEKGEVCLFQGVTVLGPGQSLVQYFEGELCYTVQCLHYKDPHSGFHAMEITSVNCSQKCGPVRIRHINMKFAFIVSYSCIVCISLNPRCVLSTRCMHRPQTLRCAVAPAKTSPATLPMKTDRRSFSL